MQWNAKEMRGGAKDKNKSREGERGKERETNREKEIETNRQTNRDKYM